MKRVELTKLMASELLKSRLDAGMSQYELADQLGWVRSKIKRIEKAEVASIAAQDLDQLKNVLENVETKVPAARKHAAPRRSKLSDFEAQVEQHMRLLAGATIREQFPHVTLAEVAQECPTLTVGDLLG